MTTTDSSVQPAATGLLGWDCIEFWVGNARTTAGFLMSAFGFRCTAYAGPETGHRATKASYVLEQGDIRFVVTGALDRRLADRRPRAAPTATACTTSPGWSTTPTAAHDAARRPRRTPRARARGPSRDEHGDLALAQIAAYGETRAHVRRPHPLPRRRARARLRHRQPPDPTRRAAGRARDDRPRRRQRRAGPPRRLGRTSTATCSASPSCCTSTTTRSAPSTRRSCRRSCGTARKIVHADQRAGRRAAQEPDPGVPRAPTTARACSTSRCAPTTSSRPSQALRDRGVRFMAVPDEYYDEAEATAGGVRPAVGRAAAAQHPGRPRRTTATSCRSSPRRSPTGRRCSSRSSNATARSGFGEGNFKALFEAIERDQAAARQPLSVEPRRLGRRSPTGSDFPLENLPFGVVRPPRWPARRGASVARRRSRRRPGRPRRRRRPGAATRASSAPISNPFLASADAGAEVREPRSPSSLGPGHERRGSLHRGRRRRRAAAGRGRRLRRLLLVDPPRHEPRPDPAARRPSRCCPNWRHLPSATTAGPARSWSSGHPVRRPRGPRRRRGDGVPADASRARALDFELEVGFVVGVGTARRPASRPTTPTATCSASCCCNDWSRARHPGVRVPAARAVPRQALRHDDLAVGRAARRAARRISSRRRRRTPCPTRTCAPTRPWALDLELEVDAQRHDDHAARASRDMYWTFAQQLAHLTVQRRDDPRRRPVRVGHRDRARPRASAAA